MITKVNFFRFTAFDKLDIQCHPGINVFIGPNATGKTHILKAIYAACAITPAKNAVMKTGRGNFAEKINNVFAPSNGRIGRLVRRKKSSTSGHLEVWRTSGNSEIKVKLEMSNHVTAPQNARVSGPKWMNTPIEAVYIPVKEMLSNAPGFRSLYQDRMITFDETYSDIIDKAYRPFMKGPTSTWRKTILAILNKSMKGKVEINDQEFFLKDSQGKIEFNLLAEGIRKLGLLWVLVQNETILNGSVLCWDEPETNLHPRLIGTVVEILLELQRAGVQIFISTHNYVLLKELQLQTKPENKVTYHSLHFGENKEILLNTSTNYSEIHPNTITQTFADLYDREITASLKN